MTNGALTADEITRALWRQLTASKPFAAILSEVPCAHARLDLLAVDDRLNGFEIKSDYDTLDRVDSQLDAYARFCQTLTFVAGPKLAVRLLRTAPAWTGIVLAMRTEVSVRLVTLRDPRLNPFADAEAAVVLLKHAELLKILQIKRSRAALRASLIANRHRDDVFATVAEALKQRVRARSGEPPRLCDDSSRLEAISAGCPDVSSP